MNLEFELNSVGDPAESSFSSIFIEFKNRSKFYFNFIFFKAQQLFE